MRQRCGPLVSIGVAWALLSPTLILAQVTKEEVLILELPANKRDQVQKDLLKRDPIPGMLKLSVVPTPARPNLIDQADPFVQQIIEQYRPAVWVEYHFIRSVCELTEEQRKQVAREAERTLGDVAMRYAELRRGGQLRRPGVPPTPLPDLRKLIQDGLGGVVAAHLTPEQVTRYRVEVSWRAEQRKRATIQNLVAKLDQELILSEKQRADLVASLSTHWSDSWFPTPAIMLNAERFLSRVPSHYIVPLLNEPQREVWEGLRRNQVNSGATIVGFSAQGNDLLEDDDLAEAREAADRARMRIGRE